MPKASVAWLWNMPTVIHIAAYGLLAGLLLAWSDRALLHAAVVVIGLTAFGAALEAVQILLPDRRALLLDVFINLVGALCGAAVVMVWRWFKSAADG